MLEQNETNEEMEQSEKEASEAKTNELKQQEKAESNAAERLDAVFNEHPSTPDLEKGDDPEPTPDPDPGNDPEPDPQNDDPEPDPDPNPEPDPAGDVDDPDAKPAGDDDVKLTQAEIRAAKHNGWKEDDIKELAKENPELAKRTCAKMLEDTNSLSQAFAKLGRESKPEIKPEEKPEVKKTEFKPVDVGQLREKYGDDDPVIDLFEQQQEMLKTTVTRLDSVEAAALSASTTKVDTAQARADKEADAAITQQIVGFFDDPELAAYGEFYGETKKGDKDWSHLTMAQLANRQDLVEEAGNIKSGAEQRGTEMELSMALDKAHLMATVEVREQVIRKDIKSKSKKRAAGITLKPSSSSKPSGSGEPTMEKAEANASVRLHKVFNK